MLRPWQIHFRIDEREEKTVFLKLTILISQGILSGRLVQGTMLPGSRSLSKELGINRKTVQAVYEELEAQGWLVTRPRKGTFVADVLPEKKPQIEPRADRKVIINEKPIIQEVIQRPHNDGVPDPRLIPYELFSRAYRHALIKITQNQYMGYGDPRGMAELRQALKQMLSMEHFMNVAEDEICIVRGSQMGIFLASRALPNRQGVIVVEELYYPSAVKAFQSNGFQVMSVKLDDQGIVIEDLERILKEHSVAAIYTTPHHQYPTTVTMTMSRRLQLLELSKKWGFYIIEDDYDHEFHYDSRPMPPLASLPHSELVIHVGSLSKVFAPGIRLGYIVAAPTIIQTITEDILLIDRQGNNITELALADLMQRGEIKRHIRKMKKIYQLRRDHALAEFQRVFAESIQIQPPAGGMALWVKFQKSFTQDQLIKLKELNIDTEQKFKQKECANHCIRFGFAALSEKEITSLIETLNEAL
ncbi:PLP-dependent aminotransferase family protein [Acinetobacter baumannii]|uniref:Aminotransferase class I/II-fold pyridoxal phosphate-dependent enzyme n=1 Tax=Acinetobacter baumannii TaxID=470 RepID=A0A6I4HQT0_ACIBA|nr:PLP-dependent aminotransferase family protein [Acinetobacter baumannii]MBF6719775.1 PLP-dependent aminotransferase family protein [Acinetobacter baumannii]MBF6738265.1 PLP-dependent aminotransferase family protein [Acinetobacter baumannii]MBF6749685.1 PLP-dependent aminotransferase family protein [Acinetobacter baumannii]MBF6753345.1 PLP-dependent aminotransferase family protein [Acinetobacter baumannii]